jgi:arylsulfatase A-like enzyme
MNRSEISMNKNLHNKIIFITLDGFRKDKVDFCPTLKSYVDESTTFSNMMTVAPYTLAAHHAMFSGMYPSRNGVNAYYNMFRFKKNEIQTIPQFLNEMGYHTCCDIINDVVIPTGGFNEVNIFDEKTVDFKSRHKKIIQKISSKDKFFLFLHYTEPHKNYVVDIVQKYKDKENKDDYFAKKDENDARYTSYMSQLDEYVKTILQTIRNCNLENDVTVIMQADHGTGIGEKNGEMFYGAFVYDSTANVFSLIHIPGSDPKIINSQCQNIDFFPTIAEMASYPKEKLDSRLQGSSLFHLISEEESSERPSFIETGGLYGPWPSPKRHNVFAIRLNQKKLIFNDTPNNWEFYDLKNDPDEEKNIYDENNEEIKTLKSKLIQHLLENNIETKIS